MKPKCGALFGSTLYVCFMVTPLFFLWRERERFSWLTSDYVRTGARYTRANRSASSLKRCRMSPVTEALVRAIAASMSAEET